MSAPTMGRRLTAEAIGTFWLVLGGCGAAMVSANPEENTSLGIGFLGVAFAFGLTVLTGVYAFGHISGGHFNPAVTLGAALAKRTEWNAVPGYWIAQVIGGVAAGTLMYAIGSGRPGWSATGNMAANGYGVHSPSHFSLTAVLITEAVLTAMFLLVILGSTDARAPKGFAGLSIGLMLTLIQPRLHSDLEHLGQPGPVDRGGVLQRRRSAHSVVGVLAGTAGGRRGRRGVVPAAVR
ncbi:aquaporin Z [Mycobacterium sp. OTB74]|nr:aquaporin Z [Mycobacterium sp. OTB74]